PAEPPRLKAGQRYDERRWLVRNAERPEQRETLGDFAAPAESRIESDGRRALRAVEIDARPGRQREARVEIDDEVAVGADRHVGARRKILGDARRRRREVVRADHDFVAIEREVRPRA